MLSYGMLSIEHQAERLAPGFRGEAFLLGGNRLAVRTRWLRHRNVSSNLAPRANQSGTVPVAAVAAPDRQPRDWAPRYPTVRNIARAGRNFHLATLSHNVSDWARHERSLP